MMRFFKMTGECVCCFFFVVVGHRYEGLAELALWRLILRS